MTSRFPEVRSLQWLGSLSFSGSYLGLFQLRGCLPPPTTCHHHVSFSDFHPPVHFLFDFVLTLDLSGHLPPLKIPQLNHICKVLFAT